MDFRRINNYLRGELKYILTSRRCFTKEGKLFLSRFSDIQVGVESRMRIGKHLTIESGSLLAARDNSELTIGNNVYINRNCQIVAHNMISIGSNVTIGPNTCIFDHDHDLHDHGKFCSSEIVIGEGSWIGANVIILKGVHIGNDSVVGAGSIVLKDIPDHSVFIQKRNDIIKQIDDGKRMNND